jgi:hypothetical protein
MGLYKVEKPVVPKELIRPALMIMSPANTFKPCTLSQDASNPASYPTINRRKGPFVAMLKVFEPPQKGTIALFDDHCQARAIAAPEDDVSFAEAQLGADDIAALAPTADVQAAGIEVL